VHSRNSVWNNQELRWVIDWKEGIFGKIQSYIGMVEVQGRGTLHLYILLWLKNAPNAMEMKTALKSENF